MTGTNGTLDAARNGPEKQRQLLREARLADGNLFSHLTAHANGRPLYVLCYLLTSIVIDLFCRHECFVAADVGTVRGQPGERG